MSDLVMMPPSRKVSAIKHFCFCGLDAQNVTTSSTNIIVKERFRSGILACGSNKYKQINDSEVAKITKPVECAWAKTLEIIDYVCGKEFIVVITNDQRVEVHGIENKIHDKVSHPRGLSALGSMYAFAFGLDSVFIGSTGKADRIIKMPESIVVTAICEENVLALDQSGKVYLIKENDLVVMLDGVEKVKSMKGGIHSATMIGYDHTIYTFSEGNLCRYYYSGNLVTAVSQAGIVIGLSESSVVYGSYGDHVLTPMRPYNAPFKFASMLADSFTYLDNNDMGVVIAKLSGFQYPHTVPESLPIKPGSMIGYINEEFIYAMDEKIYTTKSVFDLDKIQGIDTASVTSTGRTIRFEENADDKMLLVNMMKGDILTIRRDDSDKTYKVVGYAESAVWVQNDHENFVMGISTSSIDSIWENIVAFERPGHTMHETFINGRTVWVDTTPEFCAKYGYEPNDLVWIADRGIVEVYGIFCGKLVLLDISTYVLFTEECLEWKVVRRVSKNLPHTRRVVKIDGTVVDLDISACNCIFMPTDRVSSPYGEATVLGVADTIYIQTDEMRMNGYEAVDVNPLDLNLVRRIHGRAARTVKINGKEVEVSLNTEDMCGNALPGDKVIVNAMYGSVIGFAGEKVVVSMRNEDTICTVEDSNIEIIYRSDIGAMRIGSSYKPLQVGSPILEEAAVLPGDIVEHEELGVLEFMGCDSNNTIFISKKDNKAYTICFGFVMCGDMFTIIDRPAVPGWKPE